MGGININVHPLFYVFGFYYALTGRIFVFVIYTVTAVLHELGHSFVASGAGYRLNKITLMPFGAVVSGQVEGLLLKDQVKIALAGPFLNLAIGLFCVACWWIYPISYAYTDVIAEANFSMALINFIPVFPLDGGRVLTALLSYRLKKEKATLVSKIVGGVFSAILLALFVLSLFYTPNPSLLFFSLFVIFGCFGRERDNKYVKFCTAMSEERLKKGLPVKKQALSVKATVKKMLSIIDEGAVNEIEVYDGEKKVATLSQAKINSIVEKGDLYALIEKYL